MGQKQKLLDKAERNPSGLSFLEFQCLMQQCGWRFDHQRGSHQIWYSSTQQRISIQNRKGMAKAYQVKQFLGYFKGESYEHKR